MSTQNTNPLPDPPYSRKRLSLIALLALATIGVGLNLWIALPFVPALAWAFAFAVVASPMHRWMKSRISRRGRAAALSVSVVALALVLPMLFLVWQIATQAGEAASSLEGYLDSDEWRQRVQRFPYVANIWAQVEQMIDLEEQGQRLLAFVQQTVVGWMGSAVSGVIQLLIALFALFYFFRDHELIVRGVRSIMPMSDKETDQLFKQVRETTHATIYGTVVVSGVQGFLGGLMFWILGLPGSVVWGAAMGLLAIIPVFGAFVIWLPAAVYLAVEGAWMKAVILTAWGSIVVGLIDNLLYPILVGNELRLHTLPVFIAIVGGLITFGASGVVLGPVILASTLAILNILRQRTARGRSAKQEITEKAA